jgi:peptidoglycan/LPS O-acetylase OafA/YrhL
MGPIDHTGAAMSERPISSSSGGLSRVPYLPGLDGLRAIAVIGVMIYHANHSWLRGGYLGVEVFFVISGYLITLLLVGEHERSGTVNLKEFWYRRGRRLLPALYVMMAALVVYIAAFYPAVREQTRGDFVAGLLYVSNWYQILVGQGYASAEAFVPLRHLWSLAVEEQFYLLWPLVMVVVLRHTSGRRLPSTGIKLIGASLLITVVTAFLFADGFVPLACSAENSNGYWHLFGRCISVNDFLYLGSFTRAGGLLLGAGFALLWRPAAILRGPLRHKGRQLDVLAAFGMLVLGFLMWSMFLFEKGKYNPWVFRGGLFLTGIATLLVIAAATHRIAVTGRLLGNPFLKWAGIRSYGLYLYHWPIYQIIRKQAQIPLSVFELIVAWILPVAITEASYRFIETPIRTGQWRSVVAVLRGDTWSRVAAVSVMAVVALAVTSMAVADPQCVGAVQCSLQGNDPELTTPSTVPTTVPSGSSEVTVATTTTVPKVPTANVAIGESVMVGAKAQLESAGMLVNAKENRGPDGVKNAILQLVDSGDIGLGTTLVVQVGTNAPVSDEQFDAIMQAVPPDAAGVVFMTLAADVDWVPGNNDRINALPTRYANVRVLDWASESKNIALCPDGIHITCSIEALNFYANLILGEVGLPTIPTETTPPTETTG